MPARLDEALLAKIDKVKSSGLFRQIKILNTALEDLSTYLMPAYEASPPGVSDNAPHPVVWSMAPEFGYHWGNHDWGGYRAQPFTVITKAVLGIGGTPPSINSFNVAEDKEEFPTSALWGEYIGELLTSTARLAASAPKIYDPKERHIFPHADAVREHSDKMEYLVRLEAIEIVAKRVQKSFTKSGPQIEDYDAVVEGLSAFQATVAARKNRAAQSAATRTAKRDSTARHRAAHKYLARLGAGSA
ncbi:MAG: hypothetical protein SFW62_05755 [Alphaproteobacteria bacterium]|nr:hypothetical protein [Alphaproteobacteria bacterium]